MSLIDNDGNSCVKTKRGHGLTLGKLEKINLHNSCSSSISNKSCIYGQFLNQPQLNEFYEKNESNSQTLFPQPPQKEVEIHQRGFCEEMRFYHQVCTKRHGVQNTIEQPQSQRNHVDVLTQLLNEVACTTTTQAEFKYFQKTFYEAPPRPNVIISTPTNNDVLMGRGGLSNNHPGNKMFRKIVHMLKGDYVVASKAVKPRIARRIVHALRNTTTLVPPCRFLKKCPTLPNMWFDVGDKEFIMKTSQTLRDKGAKNEEDLEINPQLFGCLKNDSESYESNKTVLNTNIAAPHYLGWDTTRSCDFAHHGSTKLTHQFVLPQYDPTSTLDTSNIDKVSSLRPMIDDVNDDDSLLGEQLYFEGVDLSGNGGIKRKRSLDGDDSELFEFIHDDKKLYTEEV